jgi:hypothetical protein
MTMRASNSQLFFAMDEPSTGADKSWLLDRPAVVEAVFIGLVPGLRTYGWPLFFSAEFSRFGKRSTHRMVSSVRPANKKVVDRLFFSKRKAFSRSCNFWLFKLAGTADDDVKGGYDRWSSAVMAGGLWLG